MHFKSNPQLLYVCIMCSILEVKAINNVSIFIIVHCEGEHIQDSDAKNNMKI